MRNKDKTEDIDKVTLSKIATIEQKLNDSILYNEKAHDRIDKSMEKLTDSVNLIIRTLTVGEGKIARNYKLVEDHIKDHKDNTIKNIAISTGIASFIVGVFGLIISYFKK